MVDKVITRIRYPVLIALLLLGLCGVAYAAGNIDPTNKYAWGSNVGWINFNPNDGGVTVYADHLEGYAWGENIGWIRLGSYDGGGSHTYANTSATNYGVNRDASGNLSGYAWGTNVGWINFNPSHGGVTIDPATGSFDGYAWGENIGWIHFKNASPEYNVVTTWLDTDGDGVPDHEDVCPATVIPESVPTVRLGTNRWALVDYDFNFDTKPSKGKGPKGSYTTTDTAGCSCEQIIAAQGLDEGHTKRGCSIGAMNDWVALVNP